MPRRRSTTASTTCADCAHVSEKRNVYRIPMIYGGTSCAVLAHDGWHAGMFGAACVPLLHPVLLLTTTDCGFSNSGLTALSASAGRGVDRTRRYDGYGSRTPTGVRRTM